eukprot:gene6402-12944_t
MNEEEAKDAAMAFAHLLKIDIENKQELESLLYIAEEGLKDLPDGCEAFFDETNLCPFYYFEATGESEWEHPKMKKYLKLADEERKRFKMRSKDNDSQDNSENKSSGKKTRRRSKTDVEFEHEQVYFDEGNHNHSHKGSKNKKDKHKDNIDDITEIEDFDNNHHDKKSSYNNKKEDDKKSKTKRRNSRDQNAFGMDASDFLLIDDDNVVDDYFDTDGGNMSGKNNNSNNSNSNSKQQNKSKDNQKYSNINDDDDLNYNRTKSNKKIFDDYNEKNNEIENEKGRKINANTNQNKNNDYKNDQISYNKSKAKSKDYDPLDDYADRKNNKSPSRAQNFLLMDKGNKNNYTTSKDNRDNDRDRDNMSMNHINDRGGKDSRKSPNRMNNHDDNDDNIDYKDTHTKIKKQFNAPKNTSTSTSTSINKNKNIIDILEEQDLEEQDVHTFNDDNDNDGNSNDKKMKKASVSSTYDTKGKYSSNTTSGSSNNKSGSGNFSNYKNFNKKDLDDSSMVTSTAKDNKVKSSWIGETDDEVEVEVESEDGLRGGGSGGTYNKSSSKKDFNSYRTGTGTEYISESNKLEVESMKRELQQLKSSIEEKERNFHTSKKELLDTIDDIRNQLKRSDEKYNREKEEKDSLDLKTKRLQDENESRIRELTGKIRHEVEEEWRDREKIVKNRHLDEIEEMRIQIQNSKKMAEEAIEDAVSTRRRLVASREDGKLEGTAELESIKLDLIAAEERIRIQNGDLKKLREDNINISARLASILQSSQIAVAEAEAAKAEAAASMSEGHTNHAALVKATQRIQQLETETARLRAENVLYRQETDTLSAELRKLQNMASNNGDKLGTAEMESKRLRVQAQAEISRLVSRVAELEGSSSVLREQLDRSADRELQAVRAVEANLDKAEHDVFRLKARLLESEGRTSGDSVRITGLERDIVSLQDQIFKQERLLAEERQRSENGVNRVEEVKRRYDAELVEVRHQLQDEKNASSELVRKHREEIESLQLEVSERIPLITAAAAQRVEAACHQKSNNELIATKQNFEEIIQRQRRESLQLQAALAETDSRNKINNAEEKSELERLRALSKRLQRRIEEQDELLEGYRMDNMKNNHNRNFNYQQKIQTANSIFGGPAGSTFLASGSGTGAGMTGMQNNNNNTSIDNIDPGVSMLAALIQGQLSGMKSQLANSLSPPPRSNNNNSNSNSNSMNNSNHNRFADLFPQQRPFFPEQTSSSSSSTATSSSALNQNTNHSESDHHHHPLNSSDVLYRSHNHHNMPPHEQSFKATSTSNSTGMFGDAMIPLSPQLTRQSSSSRFAEFLSPESINRPQRDSSLYTTNVSFTTAFSNIGSMSDNNTTKLNRNHLYDNSYQENRHSNINTTTNNNEMAHIVPLSRITDDFEAIFDGGYHEGYWKAKYIKDR